MRSILLTKVRMTMERKVTPRSSLTAHERSQRTRSYQQEVNETRQRYREDFINQYNRNWNSNHVNRPPVQYTPRPIRPDIRNTPRPIPGPPNGGGPGGIIEGQLTKPPTNGARIPWGMQENLRWRMRQLARLLGYGNPWLRALNFALDAYDFYQFVQDWNRGPGGFTVGNGFNRTDKCSGGPGVITRSGRWLNPCVSHYGSVVSEWGNTTYTYHNVDWADVHPVFGWPMHWPLARFTRSPGHVGEPNPQIKPYLPVSPTPQFPVVPQNPTIPVPFRPAWNHPDTNFGPQPMTESSPDRPRPIPPLPGPPHKPRPPGPGEKEKKVRVPAPLMGAFRAATAVTEAIDLVDALWDALPKKHQKGVKKSGRTDKRARLGEGVAYSTPLDKAQHILKNWKHLNPTEAVKNIMYNHFEDKVIGGLNRGADKTRDQGGGIGWTYNF